jgi:glutathione S-transferase
MTVTKDAPANPIPANIAQEQKLHAESKALKPGEEDLYRIWQAQASPYSYKVMTYMNYKGIAYKKVRATVQELAWADKVVGQSIVPVMLVPDGQVMQDSTPIMVELEKNFPAISTVPADARLAFIMWLIEEFSDEYMPRIHMHTRWGNAQNQNTVSHRIARSITFGSADMDTQSLAPVLLNRQSGFDKHLGLVGEAARESMDLQIEDLLAIFEAHFLEYQFLLGFKPSMADFALYGSLKVHLYDDPQSNEILETTAPRTCNWLQSITDLGDTRGCAGQTEFGDWIDVDQGLPESLQALLAFIGKTYIPFAASGAAACVKREKSFEAEVYGVKATFSAHQYRGWSFEQLQLRYESLSESDKAALEHTLADACVMPAMMADGILHNGLFDGFTPPYIKGGIPDARIKRIKEKQQSGA